VLCGCGWQQCTEHDQASGRSRAIGPQPASPRPRAVMDENEQYFFEALDAGAGYVLKSVADQDLLNACHAAMRGELFIDPGVMCALMRSHWIGYAG